MALAERAGVRAPRDDPRAHARTSSAPAAEALGYPERDVCMKPPEAKGSRGFRVLSANVDRRCALLEARPGPAAAVGRRRARRDRRGRDFPPLLVMELATGKEHTVDGICRGGRLVLGHAKTREADARRPRDVLRDGRPARRSRPRRAGSCAELALDWFVNVQFIGDHLLEINPRISTIVYQDDLNLPYLAVRHAVGELDEEQLGVLPAAVRPTRRALRYYDQVEYDEP